MVSRRSVLSLGLFFLAGFPWFAPPRGRPGPPGKKRVKYRIRVDFSPFLGAADPGSGVGIPPERILELVRDLAPYVREFRTYGSRHGLEAVGPAAHRFGAKASVGAWIGRDREENGRELESLVRIARSGGADRVIVGSEVFLRGDLPEAELVSYIRKVKKSVPRGIPVAYAENYEALLRHPAVVAEVDEVFVNYYPFWKGIPVKDAVAALHGWHQRMKAFCRGRKVVVSETGWPSAGKTVGKAVPSRANAAFYFRNFVSWARATGTEFFYFEAFDEAWKARYEGPNGAHWGIWDERGKLKYGEEVFQGKVMEDNWSRSVPGGPGKPEIEITLLSKREDPKGRCAGRIWHVDPKLVRVAVYVRAGGPWRFAAWAAVGKDGMWRCSFPARPGRSGAEKVAAFLLKKDFEPPREGRGKSLSLPPVTEVLARAEAAR